MRTVSVARTQNRPLLPQHSPSTALVFLSCTSAGLLASLGTCCSSTCLPSALVSASATMLVPGQSVLENDGVVCDKFLHKVVASANVLGPGLGCAVAANRDGSLVVGEDGCWPSHGNELGWGVCMCLRVEVVCVCGLMERNK